MGREPGIVRTYLRVGTLFELQYRVNFFLQLVQSLVALGTAVAVIALVFSYTDDLAGWSPYELLVIVGVHVLLGGVIRAFIQPSMQRLMEDIREGTFDHVLVKPADAQLLASVQQFSIWQLVDVVVGAAVIAVAVANLDTGLGPLDAGAFALTLVLGAVTIYCFWLLITVGAFWIVRMEFVAELFNGLYQAGRWPVTIYPAWLQIGFTVLIPLAFAITVPAEALTGRLGGTMVLAALGFTAAIVAVTRWAWRRGLRRYDGASA
ncbi:MAG: ABC-2 family transporter protein [Actinobacteria bacterium]|nr:ABC-2 family transporter protein [Actinomycetota bacterium]